MHTSPFRGGDYRTDNTFTQTFLIPLALWEENGEGGAEKKRKKTGKGDEKRKKREKVKVCPRYLPGPAYTATPRFKNAISPFFL